MGTRAGVLRGGRHLHPIYSENDGERNKREGTEEKVVKTLSARGDRMTSILARRHLVVTYAACDPRADGLKKADA